MTKIWAFALGLLLSLGSGTWADAPPHYRLTVLPLTFYSLSGHGCGINNRGQVVGDSSSKRITRGNGESPLLRLALWQKGKTRLPISVDTHLWMDRSSTAAGINDRGQVAGNFQGIQSGAVTSYVSRAFFWTPERLELIPSLPGDDYGAVRGLNNFGEAVGASVNSAYSGLPDDRVPKSAGLPHAFLYRKRRTTLLGVGSANVINDRGQIVGTSEGQAVLWQNGVKKTLSEGEASALNNHGWVAGFAAKRPGDTRACLWRNGGQALLSAFPSQATGVNDLGQVVGMIETGQSRGSRAVLWQRGRQYDLNLCVLLPHGWVLENAEGINDRGWIIGEGQTGGGAGFTFLLTPRGRGKKRAGGPRPTLLSPAVAGRPAQTQKSGARPYVTSSGVSRSDSK